VLPFVKEAAPILQKQVRPFARAAQPFQRNLGAASRDLANATPDLTAAFHELNRLFDMGAYNPGGTEGISEGCEKGGACTPEERARNEGYLYWLAWVGQNTVSLFSTADALGPIRRAYLLNLNCAAFTAGAKQAGMGDTEAQGLSDLFGSLGACSAP
jgi:phospholipid/cholesterol/gamma-HCH transport system substrate-binding protein